MTIKDIAKRCGVSVSTVSRALNGHPDVSEALREKILQVVQEVHYVPNNSAQDLVKQQSDTIGLVVRGGGNPFFSEVIRSIEHAIALAGYTLVLHQLHSEDDELLAGARLARSKKLRGLIFLGGRFDYTPEDVSVLGVPFVCCSYTNRYGSLDDDSYSSVSIDDRQEAYKAVRTLIEYGHRSIAVLLDAVDDHSIAEMRYKGYCKALEEAGIPLSRELVIETGAYDMPAAYMGMRRLLGKRDDFTAVFAISDSMAMAAMKALHDAGKRVPDDCSVIAIDGIVMSEYAIPTLTTLVQPKENMGRISVEILLDMIRGGANRHTVLTTTLRPGESLRAIR